MVGKEDDTFLLGFGNFLGENSLLNFRGGILLDFKILVYHGNLRYPPQSYPPNK